MRRLLIYVAVLSFAFIGLLALTPKAYAVNTLPDEVCNNPNATTTPAICKDNQSGAADTENPIFGPKGILTKVINILSLIVGVVSVFVIIISGIKFITSSGDPASTTNARNTLLYAVIALFITVAAQAGVRLILARL